MKKDIFVFAFLSIFIGNASASSSRKKLLCFELLSWEMMPMSNHDMLAANPFLKVVLKFSILPLVKDHVF